MLALAHGSKGILFFLYDSWGYTDDIYGGEGVPHYIKGLVDTLDVNGNIPVNDLWYLVHDNLTPRLKGKLGKTLMNLDYTGGYINKECSSCGIHDNPSLDYLEIDCNVSSYFWHAGFFEQNNYSDNKYFLLTNLRVTVPVSTDLIVSNNTGYENVSFRDVEGGIDTTIKNNESITYNETMPAGEGKLYQVAPVVKYGGKLIYNETISNTTTLLDEMTIEDDAALTVNSTYNVDRAITIKDNGSIVTTSGGTMKFYNELSLVIEGSVTISGTAQHQLILDFLSPADSNGIIIKPGGSLTILYCEIKNAGTGIFSELNADSLIVEYVDFIDCENNSISIAGRSGEENVPIRIENCTIDNSEYGIYVNNTSSILIRWNEITDTDCGIYLSNVSDALILLNNIASSNEELQGILSLSSGGIIYGNTLNGFTSAIQLGNSSPKIGVNTITDNKYHGIYVGTGSNPYMKAAYLGNPAIPYGLSGYNTIYENGGYYESHGPADNDGSEIYFYNSTAVLDSGCNIIKDDRSVSPPLINTLRLMTRTSGGFPITLYARNNFWGDTVYSSRFYGMNVIYTPYRTEPCAIPGGGGEEELVMMDQFGTVIDTIYATGMVAPELSETESAYAEAEKYYLTGDLSSALQIYESIISSGATDDEKYFAYERKYTIGKLQNESPEYFNNLSGVFSNLAANTEDSLAMKRLTQFSTLSKVGEQEYETAINEFDEIIQQNPNTEEAVYAEIDALTTALLIEDNDSTLQKGRLGKYLIKSSSDYHRKVDEILRKNFGGSTKENAKELLPTEYTLYQNYPNPFNPTTTIKYDLPYASDVSLIIYDILGRKVKELVSTKQSAGKYEIQFDASNLASGIYIYQLIADKFISSKKMILLK
jgi:parallel beta-helix repeat protein